MIELKPLAPREAITYFQSKGFAPVLQRFHYQDLWREEHARNFVVAKGMRDDVLKLIREELLRSMREGRTLTQFQEDMKPALQAAGWWGEAIMRDPVTGAFEEVKLGSMRRLRTIYDTNMRTAHAAGHWARIQRTQAAFPYLQYIQIERPSKRHDHARFHDHIWRVDNPIWRRIFPPNGYFCGCHTVQRTEGWMQRHGREVSITPDLDEQPWVHKRTGEVQDVPRGITPGFDTNPGAVWLDIEARVAEAMPDLAQERQAHVRGVLQGLRLRRMAIGRETLTILDADGTATAIMDADIDTPDRVPVGELLRDFDTQNRVSGVELLHSHITDAPLSFADIQTLKHPRVRSITAVSPGGAIWRARPAQEILGPQFAEFSARAIPVWQNELFGMPQEDATYIINHALALFLERRGAIHYHFGLTDRLSQFFSRHADLIERLSK